MMIKGHLDTSRSFNVDNSHTFLDDKLATLGMLFASLVHEMSNPMSFILANLEEIHQKIQIPLKKEKESLALAEMDHLVNFSIEGVNKVVAMIYDIKNFLRVDNYNFDPTHIHSILNEAINMAYPQFKYKSCIEKDFSKEVPVILSNRDKLYHVFINIIVNAAQSIESTTSIKDNCIKIKTYVIQDQICVEISDTGTGIPQNILERIFEPFFTTKPIGIGTGLGLSIAKNIIESLGGSISVISKKSKGSKFSIYLPINHNNSLV